NEDLVGSGEWRFGGTPVNILGLEDIMGGRCNVLDRLTEERPLRMCLLFLDTNESEPRSSEAFRGCILEMSGVVLLQDILPRILNQLGPDSLRNLAEQFKQQQGVGAGEGATPMPAIQEDYTLTFTYLELQDYQL
ncbi:hypothetical protein Tco_1181683, partial [Tanacetum coccineum]